MPRGGNINDVDVLTESDVLSAARRGDLPVEDVKQTLRNNIHQANRTAKKRLESAIKEQLDEGVPAEGYAEEYAEWKNKSPKAKGPESSSRYSESGPVDFLFSGRLRNELTGRGRARPSVPSLQVWLGLRHPNRVRPKSAPGGGGISYSTLADWLKDNKSGAKENPFNPGRNAEKKMAARVADEMFGLDD